MLEKFHWILIEKPVWKNPTVLEKYLLPVGIFVLRKTVYFDIL